MQTGCWKKRGQPAIIVSLIETNLCLKTRVQPNMACYTVAASKTQIKFWKCSTRSTDIQFKIARIPRNLNDVSVKRSQLWGQTKK